MSAELQLDKSGWKPVTFGDVVQEVRQTTKDPVADGIERVVGLEHIKTECIHLRHWASIEEETTFTKIFRKGHVLFGRRRAYLKKAAQAEFDGICSGDITVMETKNDLLPELFPFLVCNDKFFDYAVQHSAGGLSPRTKFKDLANYDFLLPPKDQQAKLAELLWAADGMVENAHSASQAAQTAFASKLKVLFGKSKSKRNPTFELKKLSQCVHLQPGVAMGKKPKNGEKFVSLPYLRVANVQDGRLNLDEIKEISLPEKDVGKYLLEDGDVVICEGGDFDKVGRGAIWRAPVSPCLHQNHVFCLRSDSSKILPEFLELQIQSNYGKGYFLGCAKKTSNLASINSSQVKDFPLQITDLQCQSMIVNECQILRNAITALEEQIGTAKDLSKSLLNQIF